MSPVVTDHVLPVYLRTEVTFVDGEGCWLTADDGKRYLDFAAGIAVVGLGHCHPAPRAAAHAQLDRLWHTSNLYWTEPMAELAERLSARFGGAQAFFCNSGAESIEAALKYARRSTGKAGTIALDGSFHGRTMGALSVTGQPAKQVPFEPLLAGVRFAKPNDPESLVAAASSETGAIVLEPVLGEGGVFALTPEFLADARTLASELGALLIFDEVQTGVGRTGTFFAFEQLGVKPDVVALAKGLANGLPIGCMLVADEVAGAFAYGDHASTFGGNPVSCAAACAVLDTMDEAFLARVRATSGRLTEKLAAVPGVEGVRGLGLLLAVELDRPQAPVATACFDAGLLVLPAGEKGLRLAPPLVVSDDEVDQAVAILTEVLS